MKTSDIFTYKGAEGYTREHCHFVVSRYQNNGNLALLITDADDERDVIAVCSVNGDKICAADEICIKAYSENKGMDDFLEGLGIIDDLIEVRSSGWVNLLYYKLTESGKELFANVDKR